MKVLLKRLEAGLRPLSPLTITTIALCWVLALGIADYYTPGTVTLMAFYLLAVIFAGWGAGKWHACFVSAVTAITMFTVYWVLQRGVPHPLWAALWNNATRFVVFSLAGWLAAEMTRLARSLEEQVEERTQQWQKEADEHKLTATRLTDTVERFEQVINNITEVFWLTNVPKNQMVYISPGYEHVWGRKCQELYRDPASWLAAVHPDDHETVARRSHSEQAAGGYEIEYRIVRPDGAVRWVRDRAFPVRNAQGEVYRVAGVAEDITERKQARQTLQMQAAILENMAEGVVVTDDQGLIVQMNPAAEQIWGYPRSEVVGKPASRLHGSAAGDYTARRKDGTLIEVETRSGNIVLGGQPFVVMVGQDVTQRKRAETALREAHDHLEQRVQERTRELQTANAALVEEVTERKRMDRALREAHDKLEQRVQERTADLRTANAALAESEERYRSLVDNLNVGVYRNTPEPDGRFIHANPALARIHGYDSAQEFENIRAVEFYQDPRQREAYLSLLLRRGTLRNYEVRLKKKDGTPICAAVSATVHRDSEGNAAWIDGVLEDITERKRAERLLTEALDLNQKMLAAATVGIIAYKASGECIFANEALARIVGGDVEDVLLGNFRQIEAWQQSGLVELADEVLDHGQSASREIFCETRFGKRIWLDCHVASFVSNGAPHLLLMALDISERKQAEQALKMHSLVLQSMSEGVLLVSPDQTILFANPALDLMFGYERGELIGQKVEVLNAWSPEETARFNEDMVRTPNEPATWRREYQNRRKDGTCFASEARISLVELGGRNHLIGVQQDVTERKRAEEIKRRAERLQKAILDNIPDPAWLKDAEGRFLTCNQALAKFYGQPLETIIGKTVYDFMPGEADRIAREDQAVMHTRRPWVGELATKNLDGAIRWMESIKSPLCNERDEVIGIVGIAREITERKQTESLLQAQRDLGVSLSTTSDASTALRRFMEFAVQAGGFDCGGIYLVNPATQGLDLAEHCGISAAFAQAVAHFTADSPQMRIVRQDRPRFTLYEQLGFPLDEVQRREALQAFALLPLKHEQEIIGALVAASHTGKHITPRTGLVMEALTTLAAGALARIRAEAERHRLERQLLEITDREQARIGQDIHDGLCQHLVSLAFDANSLARELSRRRRAQAPMARRMAELADQAITETRQLARGLFPVRLESEGLPSALEELARSTHNRFKIRCRFRSKGTARIPSSSIATHLYRIAQEAVANALKHGQARVISIDLTARDGQLWLKIEDDGSGLDPRPPKRADGMGLHIMDYRARSIGGTLRLAARPRGGTQVFCCIPYPLT